MNEDSKHKQEKCMQQKIQHRIILNKKLATFFNSWWQYKATEEIGWLSNETDVNMLQKFVSQSQILILLGIISNCLFSHT